MNGWIKSLSWSFHVHTQTQSISEGHDSGITYEDPRKSVLEDEYINYKLTVNYEVDLPSSCQVRVYSMHQTQVDGKEYQPYAQFTQRPLTSHHMLTS